MRKIWDKFVKWLLSIPVDRRLHFGFGFIIASFFCIALGIGPWCIIAAFIAAAFKEGFDVYTGGNFDWKDFAATIIGGALPALFVVLRLTIFRGW